MNTIPVEVQGVIASYVNDDNICRGLFNDEALTYASVEEKRVMDTLEPIRRSITKVLSLLNDRIEDNTFVYWESDNMTPQCLFSKWPRYWEYDHADSYSITEITYALNKNIVASIREAGYDCVWTTLKACSGALTVCLGEVSGLQYTLKIVEDTCMVDDSLREDRYLQFIMTYPDCSTCTVWITMEKTEHPEFFVFHVMCKDIGVNSRNNTIQWKERERQVVSWVKTILSSQEEPYLEMSLMCNNNHIHGAIQRSCGVLYGLDYTKNI